MKNHLKVAVLIVLVIFIIVSGLNLNKADAATASPTSTGIQRTATTTSSTSTSTTSTTTTSSSPANPLTLSSTGKTTTTVSLAWTPYAGHDQLLFYEVYYKPTGCLSDTCWRLTAQVGPSPTTFKVTTGLSAGASFDFIVHAVGFVVQGQPPAMIGATNIITVTTTQTATGTGTGTQTSGGTTGGTTSGGTTSGTTSGGTSSGSTSAGGATKIGVIGGGQQAGGGGGGGQQGGGGGIAAQAGGGGLCNLVLGNNPILPVAHIKSIVPPLSSTFGQDVTINADAFAPAPGASPNGYAIFSENPVDNKDEYLTGSIQIQQGGQVGQIPVFIKFPKPVNNPKVFSYTTQDLSVGQHALGVWINDSKGQFSPPVCTAKPLLTKTQDVGSPVQLIPRFVTIGNVVRGYDVTPGYPNIYCKVSHGDSDDPCGVFLRRQAIDVCKVGRLNSPVLEFDLQEAKAHVFTIAKTANTPIPTAPVVGGGELDLQLITPVGQGDPKEFGTRVDEDFLPSGLKLEVQTPNNIDKTKIGNTYISGVFYSLFRVKNCGLTEVTSLTPMDYFGRQKNFFTTFIDQPQDCKVGETCKYIGEIIALNGAESGGMLYSFSYTRQLGALTAQPGSYDFGNINPGYGENVSLSIENTGAGPIDSLSVTAASQRIQQLELDKQSVEAGDAAELKFKFAIESAASQAAGRETVNVSGISNGVPVSVIIPVTYNVIVLAPEESEQAPLETVLPDVSPSEAPQDFRPTDQGLPALAEIGAKATPTVWAAGKLEKNKRATKVFTLDAAKGKQGVTAVVNIPPELADSVSPDKQSYNLGSGETKATLTLAPNKPAGDYTGTITFEFSKQNAAPEAVDVQLAFSVEEDVQALYDSTKADYDQASSKYDSLTALLAQNGGVASKVQQDVTAAKQGLADAKKALDKAAAALKSKDTDKAKEALADAETKLASAKRALGKIDAALNEIPAASKQNLVPILVVVAVAGGIGFALFAIREGWIPLYKYPALQEAFSKMGLSSLVEQPMDFAPRPRFTPSMPMEAPRQMEAAAEIGGERKISPAPPAVGAQPIAVKPQMPPMSPEQRAKMEAYVKQHPEYAAYLKQKYRSSYDNRRFE